MLSILKTARCLSSFIQWQLIETILEYSSSIVANTISYKPFFMHSVAMLQVIHRRAGSVGRRGQGGLFRSFLSVFPFVRSCLLKEFRRPFERKLVNQSVY